MKTKLIIVSMILGALVGFLYYPENGFDLSSGQSRIFEFKDRSTPSRIRIMGEFGSFDLNLSSKIEVKNPILERSDWLLREPLFAPAKNEVVQSIINLLFEFSGEPVKEGEIQRDKLGEYGLVPPATVIMLDNGVSKEVISIGTPNEATKSSFVQRESDGSIFLANDNVNLKLQTLLSNIRSDQVLKFNPMKVKQVDVVQGDMFYRLNGGCESESGWTIVSEGLDLKADSPLINREVKELSEMRVSKMYDNPLDILQFTGLASPILIFKMKFKMEDQAEGCSINELPTLKKDELIFQIGKGVGINLKQGQGSKMQSTYYLKINGETVVYEVDKGTFGDWLQSFEHFRDKQPFKNLKPSDYDKVEVLVPEKNCVDISDISKISEQTKLISSFKDINLDLITKKGELKDYDPVNGVKLIFRSKTGCSEGIDQLGVLSQINEIGDKKAVASYVRIYKCKEPEIYGVAPQDQIDSFRNAVEKSCTSR